MSSALDVFTNRSSTISRYQATANLQFLLPQSNIPSLVTNSNFTDTLECKLGFDKAPCQEICGNTSTIFANWPNLYTCSWFPELSKAVNELNLTGPEAKSLESIGIFGSEQELSLNVSSSIGTCLSEFCQYSKQCQDSDVYNSCVQENIFISNGTSKVLNRTTAIDCVRHGICGSTAEINPDIGGLGVVLSLLIQYSISLLGIFLHFIYYLRYQITQRHIKQNSSVEDMDSRLSDAKQSLSRHLGSLTSALVEFQKSQCFFSATLQIAALIVLPTYLSQVRGKDQILLRLTAANAFSPIMLTLAHIDFLGGRNSWYLLFLSGVSFVLGTATYWASSPHLSGAAINAYLFHENPVAPVLSCGNIAPFAPCFNRNEFFRFDLWPQITGVYYTLPERSGLAVWIISFLILIYRIASKVCGVKNNGPKLLKVLRKARDRLYQSCQNYLLKMKDSKLGGSLAPIFSPASTALHMHKLYRVAYETATKQRSWEYMQLGLGSIALFLQFISIIQVLKYSSNIISTQMSFGQIVAVGIWIPVLLEYGYLEINGSARGTQYRLKSPLVVCERPAQDDIKSLKSKSGKQGL